MCHGSAFQIIILYFSSVYQVLKQGRSQKFVLGGIKVFGGWIKLLNSRSDVILPHKKFTWADVGGIYPDIPPVATPLF